MSRRAQLPDGRILEFPADTPDDVIDRTVRFELGAQRAADYPGMRRAPVPRPAPTPAPAPRRARPVTSTEGTGVYTRPGAARAAPPERTARDYAITFRDNPDTLTDQEVLRQDALRDVAEEARIGAATEQLGAMDSARAVSALARALTDPVNAITTLGDQFIRSRATSGAAAEDAAVDEGFFDRTGSLIERGLALPLAGTSRFVGGFAPGVAGDVADARSRQYEDIVNADITGTRTFEQALADPVSNLLPWIFEQGVQSLPSMVVAATPVVGLPSTFMSYAGNIAQNRADADGRSDAGLADALVSAPFGGASALLERTGIAGILDAAGANAMQRIGRAALTEGATEAAQSGIEYTGGQLGTAEGMNARDLGMSVLAGGIAGTGMGATLRGTGEAVSGAVERGAQVLQDRAAAQQQATENQLAAMQAFSPDTSSVGEGVASTPTVPPPAAVARPVTPPAPEAANPEPAAAPRSIFEPVNSREANDARWRLRQETYDKISTPIGAGAWEAAQPNLLRGDQVSFLASDGDLITLEQVGKDEYLWKSDIQESIFSGAQVQNLLSRQNIRIAQDIEPAQAAVAAPSLPPQPSAQQGAAEPAAPAPANRRRVSTPAGLDIEVDSEVVDAGSLRFAEGVMQNRDRDRAASEAQVMGIVGGFRPEWLADDNFTDRGAPIIGPDNTIESGNGRMMAINRIYDERPELADRYRQFLRDQGYNIDGMERPVLVRRRVTDLAPDQLRQFVTGSNTDNKQRLSRPEQARQDATDILSDEAMSLYMGGSLTSERNARFVERFMQSVPDGERSTFMDANGRLSSDGVARVENAMLARAFNTGSPTARRFLSRAMEQTDNQTRTLTGALSDVAPAWGRMLSAMREGAVDQRYDLTDKLLEAIAIIADTKGTSESVQNILNSEDMFNALDPTVEKLIRAWHNDTGRRMLSRAKIADMLERYVELAMEQRPTPDMFGQVILRDPADVLNDALRGDQGDLMAAEERLDGGEGENSNALIANDNFPNRALREVRPEEIAEIHIGRSKYPMDGKTFAEASKAYRSTIISMDLGVSKTPLALLVNQEGQVLAHIAYNGRVFAGRPEDFDGLYRLGLSARILYEPSASGARGSDKAIAFDIPEEEPAANVMPDRSGINQEQKGAYRTTFMEAAYTSRPSVYEGAIRATGIDPDRFRNLKPERRLAELQRVFTEMTGIPVIVDNNMNRNTAIDQLLDAFQTVQGMAYMIGVSPRALALEGTLKIRLMRDANFLGAYAPDKVEIMLPKRSNSFAHEWAHALDWHLMKAVDGKGRGLTGFTRKQGATDRLPQNTREALVELLNTMFFDKAELAARIMSLEAKISTTKSASEKAKYQAQIDNIASGRAQTQSARSNFYKGAKRLDAKGAGDYWRQPTEMFARAFEAFVAHNAAIHGLGTEVISKADEQYRSNVEERMREAYPKDEEREAIFSALGTLLQMVSRDAMLKDPGTPATEAPDAGILVRMTDLDRRLKMVENGGLLARHKQALQNNARQKAREMKGRAADPKSTAQRIHDVVGLGLYSMAGMLKTLERRYKSRAIAQVHDMLAHTPGEGRYVGQTYFEEVEYYRNRAWNRIANIVREHNLDRLTDKGLRQLRDILLSEDVEGANENLVAAAAKLRRLMDEEHIRATDAGIKLGYARGVGYLQRALDLPLVLGDMPKFIAQATKVYEVVFDKEFGSDVDEMLAQDGALKRFLSLASRLQIDTKPIKKINREISRLESAQATSDDPDQILAKLEQLYEKRAELIGDIWDAVRTGYASGKAVSWLHALQRAEHDDFGSSQPDSDFSKKRELPPETDKLLEDFYTQSPVESIINYFGQSTRRIAYARRFGDDGAKRKMLVDQMVAEGVPVEDQQMVLKILDTAVGRVQTNLAPSMQRFLSFIHSIGTMTLLGRAVLSSLTEATTAGLAGSDARAGMRAFTATLGQIKGLKGEQRTELAEAIGIITGATGDMILSQRFGGTYGEVTRWDRYLSRMFVQTGLHGLTRAQRAGTLASSHAMLIKTARDVLKGDVNAIAFMNELGIRDAEPFARQLLETGAMPSVHDLETKFGQDYALASTRFVNMTIQNPTPMARQYAAANPVGRIIYGITSFSMSFWRNVLKRHAIMTAKIYQRSGMPRAAAHALVGFLPSALLLLFMQSVVSTLREWLLNRQRWNEWTRAGDLHEKMFFLAVSRTFSLGAVDPAVQAVTGLKYQRDLANLFVGAVPGYFLQNLGTLITSQMRDSEETNTAEFNTARAAYNLAIAPSIATMLSMVPGSPIFTPLAGVGQLTATSPQAGASFAEALVGPKGMRTDPETGEPAETRAEFEERMRERQDRALEREREEEGG